MTMKLEHILEGDTPVVQVSLNFDDLEPMQIFALRAIADGRFDIETAKDSLVDIVCELQVLNLVDDDFGLTPTGEKAVELALEKGSAARRAAALKPLVPTDHDELADDDVYDGGDEFQGMNDHDISDFEMNRFGAPNQNY